MLLSVSCTLALLATTGCYREVVVTKQMTWECRPEVDRADYPGVQTALFRYVEKPRYHELEPGLHLRDDLRNSGKPIAEVRILAWGDPWDGLRGYRTEAVNGKAFTGGGNWETQECRALRQACRTKIRSVGSFRRTTCSKGARTRQSWASGMLRTLLIGPSFATGSRKISQPRRERARIIAV